MPNLQILNRCQLRLDGCVNQDECKHVIFHQEKNGLDGIKHHKKQGRIDWHDKPYIELLTFLAVSSTKNGKE
jgi:hypothetical protein